MTEGTHSSLARAAAIIRAQSDRQHKKNLRDAKRLASGSGPRPRRSGATGRGAFFKSSGKAASPKATSPGVVLRVLKGALAGLQYSRQRGELVATNMLSRDINGQLKEFLIDAQTRPDLDPKNLFKHVSLSLPEGVKRSAEEWRLLCAAWLSAIGADGCLYTVQRHDDTKNQHVHIIFSRLKKDGTLVSDSFSHLKWGSALQRVRTRLGIKDVPKAPSETPRAASDRAVNAERRARRLGQDARPLDAELILKIVGQSTNFQELQTSLARAQIQVTQAEKNGRVTGLLFKRIGTSTQLAGSSVDRQLSLAAVQKQLQENAQAQPREADLQAQAQRQALAQAARQAAAAAQNRPIPRG